MLRKMLSKSIYIILMSSLAYFISIAINVVFYKVFLVQMITIVIIMITISQTEQENLMSTSQKQIGEWFDRGKTQEMDFMIVVADLYDYEDYPVFCKKESYKDTYKQYSTSPMQKIMEVYDLNQDKQLQLASGRCFNGPK
jgi:hypothetical protein